MGKNKINYGIEHLEEPKFINIMKYV